MQVNKKQRKIKQKLSDKLKQQCQQKLKKQPPMYLMTSLKDKVFTLDIDLVQVDDLPFLPILLKLPITKIHIYCQQNKKLSSNSSRIYNSYKFKDVLKQIGSTLIHLQSLKSLIFQRVPLAIEHLIVLKQSIASTQYLKQLSFKFCQLSDNHLEVIKTSIAKNQSLVIIDLSHNKLSNVGSMVGKIMSEHSSRRDELIWFSSLRGQTLEDDLSKKGICQVNLQGNQLNDRSANELVQFLKADQWSRCLNLKNNKLTIEGVKQFARLMKKNSTLISLDLRGNPGFTKQYSIYILKKLKQNIQKYREQKKGYQNYKKLKQQKTQQNIQKKNNHHKSLYQSRRQSLKKTQGTPLQFTINNNNITSLPKSRNNISSKQQINCQDQICVKCRQKTLQILKLEKKNLDLQIEIKKLKRILLTKNIDLSVILPYQQHNSIQSSNNNQQFTRAMHLVSHSQNDEDLIGRVEQIMMQLTKIMDNIDAQQNTQINISNNNISHAHSLSNTIPLFVKPSELQQLQLEESTIQMQDKGISTNIGKLTSEDDLN